mmetsp:Transcript_59735/g.139777  ORF Transcript_59735/g.139777 Transcript_59735/m.139777 type:complete len:207 (-) Transcript_59735:859-1479(-)
MLYALRLERGVGFSSDGLTRVLAASCLATQHHSIRAVPYGILHIADLCPGWNWLLDHAFHHLSGIDHEQASILGSPDQKLLSERNPFELQLHSKISPCHHQGLRLGDDAINVCQGLRLLDLRADFRPALGRDVQSIHNVDELLQVLPLLDKGHADVLDRRVQLQEILCILDVLRRQRGAVDLEVRDVDALAGLQLSSTGDLHLQLR